MIRTVVVAGALLLGVGAVMAQQDVAVKQDNLMRAQGKSMYGVILKMTKGEIPYDQKAVNAAIAQLEESVPTIPKVFETNPKEDVVNATYGSSQKIWQNKADFDSKVPVVAKTIAGVNSRWIPAVHDSTIGGFSFGSMANSCWPAAGLYWKLFWKIGPGAARTVLRVVPEPRITLPPWN